MGNNITNPFVISANCFGPNAVTRNPSTSTTALPTDDVIICGGNSVAVTLDANSNSPLIVTSIDGTTQRTSCTVVVGSQHFVIADSGCSALCIRFGPPSANQWAVIGSKTAS
jgi:hypothetical protein